MQKKPTEEELTQIAISRVDAITRESDVYKLDTQRIDDFTEELEGLLNKDQKDIFDKLAEIYQMREDELAIEIYREAYMDAIAEVTESEPISEYCS